MKCSQCGIQIDGDESSARCPDCRQEGAVRVLSGVERDNFTGETIDTSLTGGFGSNRNDHYEYRRHDHPNYSQRIYRFNLFPTTFWSKALAVLVVGLLVLVALPIFFLATLIGLIIGMFFFRRR